MTRFLWRCAATIAATAFVLALSIGATLVEVLLFDSYRRG